MGGISADDPAAIEKLQKKLDGLERSQLIMKEVNAYMYTARSRSGTKQKG